ncbi:hypothetical protein JCGZ_16224 [Jatropha curcas]|uniref:Uncharacterized protein n=1 Tax=Jatropha curcas TaxID=180498 RepID=A0A067K6L6_JATCU|nr:hypothetical protein JCGZ_16224 [Jatropha curcas]
MEQDGILSQMQSSTQTKKRTKLLPLYLCRLLKIQITATTGENCGRIFHTCAGKDILHEEIINESNWVAMKSTEDKRGVKKMGKPSTDYIMNELRKELRKDVGKVKHALIESIIPHLRLTEHVIEEYKDVVRDEFVVGLVRMKEDAAELKAFMQQSICLTKRQNLLLKLYLICIFCCMVAIFWKWISLY